MDWWAVIALLCCCILNGVVSFCHSGLFIPCWVVLGAVPSRLSFSIGRSLSHSKSPRDVLTDRCTNCSPERQGTWKSRATWLQRSLWLLNCWTQSYWNKQYVWWRLWSFVAKMTDDLKEVTNKHIDSIQALEAKVSNTEGEVCRVNKKISNNMDKKVSNVEERVS